MTQPELDQLAESVRTVAERASRGLVDRRPLVELTILAAVAQEHVLVIGAPGTAKSQAVRQTAEAIGDSYFEYLIGKFTEPNELFGPVDLVALRAGRVEVDTTDMLPEARMAFLDEVFQGSSAILNTLLGILNERVFRRGHTVRQCPLRICVAASNDLPGDPALAAFADRFLVRVFLEPITDPFLDDLLEVGWLSSRPPVPLGSQGAPLGGVLDVATAFVDGVDLQKVRPLLAQAVRLLRRNAIVLSDRRIVRSQRLVAAAAVLDGRLEATSADLWPLVNVIPTQEDQERAIEVLHEILGDTRNRVASRAAEGASLGLEARAAVLVDAGQAALDLAVGEDRTLRLEGIAREIDATFPPGALPPDLAALRARVVEELG
jgi:MoxR-like ATPase